MYAIFKNLFVCLHCSIQFSWAGDVHLYDGLFLLSIIDTKICGIVLPCISYNGLCVHESVLNSGQGDTVLRFAKFAKSKCSIHKWKI